MNLVSLYVTPIKTVTEPNAFLELLSTSVISNLDDFLFIFYGDFNGFDTAFLMRLGSINLVTFSPKNDGCLDLEFTNKVFSIFHETPLIKVNTT